MSHKINLQDYEGSFNFNFKEINSLIRRVRQRHSNHDDGGLELHVSTKAFLQNMMDVERNDRELNRHKKPAVGKIKMLPVVVKTLSNKNLHHQLLDALVLQRVRDWLRPLPDGSLPNSQLRSTLFKLLDALPIDSDHLQESEGLGIELMRLWRSPAETAANKKRLRRLVEKWIRAIFKNVVDYKDKRFAEDFQDVESGMATELQKRRALRSKLVERKGRKRTRMPAQAMFDFAVNPQTQDGNVDERDAGDEKAVKQSHKRINERFVAMEKEMRSKMKK